MIHPIAHSYRIAFASHAPYYKPSDLKSSYEKGLHYENNGAIVDPGKGQIFRMTPDEYSLIEPKQSVLTDGEKAYKVLSLGDGTITIQESVDQHGLRGVPATHSHNDARRYYALYTNA